MNTLDIADALWFTALIVCGTCCRKRIQRQTSKCIFTTSLHISGDIVAHSNSWLLYFFTIWKKLMIIFLQDLFITLQEEKKKINWNQNTAPASALASCYYLGLILPFFKDCTVTWKEDWRVPPVLQAALQIDTLWWGILSFLWREQK